MRIASSSRRDGQRLAGDEITGVQPHKTSRPERTPDRRFSSGAPAGARNSASCIPVISSLANLPDPSGIVALILTEACANKSGLKVMRSRKAGEAFRSAATWRRFRELYISAADRNHWLRPRNLKLGKRRQVAALRKASPIPSG